MNPALILLPVFALVALTFAMLFLTARSRLVAVKSGAVKIKDIALGQKAWPAHSLQLANNFQSQFELPMLFYVLAVLVLVTRQLDVVQLALAWTFVILRVAHTYIHTTSNFVPTRFRVFAAGFLVLIASWVYFAVKIVPQLI
jgi:hypothetical protein